MQTTAAPESRSVTGEVRTVLLVEDNMGDAELIREYLAEDNARSYRVMHAASLAAAALLLQEVRVDAVLLDLHLPDGAGMACIRTVRAHVREVPIVVLTGAENESLGLACIAAGAQDYLSKAAIRAQPLRRAVDYAITRNQAKLDRDRADALQARLAAIVEASTDAIVSITPEGNIASWNRGAEEILGYSKREAIGRPLSAVLRPANDAEVPGETRPGGRSGLGNFSGAAEEVVRLHKDGRAITLSVVAFELRGADGEPVVTAAIGRDVTEEKRRAVELRQRNEELTSSIGQLHALTARLNAIREEERTRISRTVHDELGQLLSGLKMDLRWIERRLAQQPSESDAAIAERLAEANKLVDSTIGTVQNIALELRPSALDALGLASAIRDEARRFGQRTGHRMMIEVEDTDPPAPEAATALFRIFQELLTNISRHAQASTVEIAFGADEAGWQLQVGDDGVGMSGPPLRPFKSLGLLGMRERASAFGGNVVHASGTVRGTVATVRIPRTTGSAANA